MDNNEDEMKVHKQIPETQQQHFSPHQDMNFYDMNNNLQYNQANYCNDWNQMESNFNNQGNFHLN